MTGRLKELPVNYGDRKLPFHSLDLGYGRKPEIMNQLQRREKNLNFWEVCLSSRKNYIMQKISRNRFNKTTKPLKSLTCFETSKKFSPSNLIFENTIDVIEWENNNLSELQKLKTDISMKEDFFKTIVKFLGVVYAKGT